MYLAKSLAVTRCHYDDGRKTLRATLSWTGKIGCKKVQHLCMIFLSLSRVPRILSSFVSQKFLQDCLMANVNS